MIRKDEAVSLRPTQWLTPTRGLPNIRDSVRATNATDCNGAPIPGPDVGKLSGRLNLLRQK